MSGAQKRADAIVIVQGLETAAESVIPIPGFVTGIINSPTVIGWGIDLFVSVLNKEYGTKWGTAAVSPAAPATVIVTDTPPESANVENTPADSGM